MSAELEQLKALLAQAQQTQAAPATGWAPPVPAAPSLPITGISIPVKVDTPLGSVRVDLHLPAECGQSQQALMSAIQALANAGYPVDAWQKKESGWGGGGGWGGNSGGGFSRGGYGSGRRW